MSFGETLQQLRTEREMSKYALEKRSGVPHANITQFENGARGVPTFRTISDLASGMALSSDDGRRLFALAFAERFLVEMEKFVIYDFLSHVTGDEVERVAASVHEQLGEGIGAVDASQERGVRGHAPSLYDQLVAIAERPDLAHLRHRLAAAIMEAVTIDFRDSSVQLRPGPMAATSSEQERPKGVIPLHFNPESGQWVLDTATVDMPKQSLAAIPGVIWWTTTAPSTAEDGASTAHRPDEHFDACDLYTVSPGTTES